MSRSHLPAAVRALALAIVTIPLLAGCRAPEEKRVFQYLNTQGFGQMATGDANVENYLVVGDSVTIRDSIHTELQLPPQDVDVDGTINLPTWASSRSRGRRAASSEALLTELYAPLYERTDIKVVIHPATALTGGGKKYFVIGEVKKHGKQTFVGDRTIFEAVHDAGSQ